MGQVPQECLEEMRLPLAAPPAPLTSPTYAHGARKFRVIFSY